MWQTNLTIFYITKFLLSINSQRGCAQGKSGCLPTRPLSAVDTKQLNGKYHSVAVEERRRYCVLCTRSVAVQNLSTNLISKPTLSVLHVTRTLCVSWQKGTAGRGTCWLSISISSSMGNNAFAVAY